jgi:arylformamidase
MRLYDISIPISKDIVTWPGDPPVSLTMVSSISDGAQCNVTRIGMGAHTGTHIDAPYHFLEHGTTVDAIPLENLIGPCFVIEVDSEDLITKKDIQSHNLEGHSRILIKTSNSGLFSNPLIPFNSNYVALGIEAARYLVEIGIILVGIDYLSIESFESDDCPVHKLLLRNHITILEGLNLSAVESGVYELICMPLKLIGCEASPARVVLRDKPE